MHLIAAAEMTPSGVPPMPISRSTPVNACAAAIDGRDVAVADQVHARAGLAQLGDQVVVAVALEHDDGDLVHVEALRLGDRADVLGRRRVDVDRVRRLRARPRSCPCRPPRPGRTSSRARRPRSRRSRSAGRAPSAASPRAGRRRRRRPARCRRRRARRCRASAPRPSPPRRSRRRRSCRRCRARAASRRRRPRRRPPSRRARPSRRRPAPRPPSRARARERGCGRERCSLRA